MSSVLERRRSNEKMSCSSVTPTCFCPSEHKMKTNVLLPSASSIFVPCVVISKQNPVCSSTLKPKTPSLRKLSVKCSSSSRPPLGPGSGENDSGSVLDAFFLGKALAEAINERIESTVGEVLSVVGRLQAEQQKQVQEFQEDVMERAKKAKEKAAREALEAQSLAPKSTTVVVSTTTDVSASVPDSSATTVTPDTSSLSSRPYNSSKKDSSNRDPIIGMMLTDD